MTFDKHLAPNLVPDTGQCAGIQSKGGPGLSFQPSGESGHVVGWVGEDTHSAGEAPTNQRPGGPETVRAWVSVKGY